MVEKMKNINVTKQKINYAKIVKTTSDDMLDANSVDSIADEMLDANSVETISTEAEETIEVYELMPTNATIIDDMKVIADLNEEFSHTMEPILRMYHAAMNTTESRLNVIKDEFKYRGLRNPIHHIDTRLKSMKSILGKLEKKDLSLSLSEACNNIYDIAGIRVVCPYIKDVYLIKERIEAQDDIHVIEVKDYIANPKPNGYRSLHMIIRVPVYFMNKKQMVPVELQIRTEAMDMWASLEHDIKYKSLYTDIGVDFSGELLECSKLIYQAESKMEYMNNLLEG